MKHWSIITGCNSLLGMAIAREALQLGYSVLGVYNKDKQRLVELQNKFPDKIKIIQANFNEKGISDLISKLDAFSQPISALVNNAGTFVTELDFLNIRPEIVIQAYAINAIAPLILSAYVFEKMKNQNKGRIINISSVSAKYGGSEKNIHYGMSKAALDAQTPFFARVGAPYNILVNSIRPGLIDTEFHENNSPGRNLKARLKLNPLGRMAKVEEIAGLVAYLLSDKGTYMTGEVLTVSGGD